MRKKKVYVLRTRLADNDSWSEPMYYETKKRRDKDGAMNRIIGGIRTWSYDEKKTLDEIEQIFFQ